MQQRFLSSAISPWSIWKKSPAPVLCAPAPRGQRVDVGDEVIHRAAVGQHSCSRAHLIAEHILLSEAALTGPKALDLRDQIPVRLARECRRIERIVAFTTRA